MDTYEGRIFAGGTALANDTATGALHEQRDNILRTKSQRAL